MFDQYKILIVGRRSGETASLRERIARNKLYRVDVSEIASDAIEKMMTEKLDLVMFNLDTFTREKIKIASEVKSLGRAFPTLILARVIAPETYRMVEAMDKTVILEKPYEDKDLWGLVDKMAQGRVVSQRIHRRFYTNQRAEIEPLGLGNVKPTQVFNLSRGGAYLEATEHNLQKGDLVRLNVNLKEISKQYVVSAKVVWTTPKGMESGQPGIGVEFLRSGDVYRNLLSKL